MMGQGRIGQTSNIEYKTDDDDEYKRGTGNMEKLERKMYLLDSNLQEKETSVDKQEVSTRTVLENHKWVATELPVLSDRAREIGSKFFVPFAKLEALPGRPDKSNRRGFYIEDEQFVALRGVGGLDMAKIWHMLIIPTAAIAGFDESQTAGNNRLEWVFDLKVEHLKLLLAMKNAALDFLEGNREYFKKVQPSELANKPLDYWLDPQNVSLGFHSVPTVGYLHMHMLVGPLTEFGGSDKNVERWISLNEVVQCLQSGHNVSYLLQST
uniref:Uncharacterized protein n=1 Tax=Mucochytrium quahogii TaxID=96639 RepID=A0A7S2SE05_9STRA|mmetsp:Transcript_8041/g.12962  ORF Transcript_8041/g.12962 Transcript_8041/m.12962 type:complete len:267 (-) Transcript_8041:232-1032(-)